MAVENWNTTLNKVELDEDDHTRGTLLGLIGEGKPYLFLTARVTGEDEDERMVVTLDTNIPEDNRHITKAILEAAVAGLN